MATLERPAERRPSITIALPPTPIRNSLNLPPLPPSPLVRTTRTLVDPTTGDATFVLPSVPTHEPEDRASLRTPDSPLLQTLEIGYANHGDVSSPRSFRRSSLSIQMDPLDNSDPRGEAEIDEEEEEEMLEELADEPQHGTPQRTSTTLQQNDLAGLVLATQAATLLALQHLLQQMHATAMETTQSATEGTSQLLETIIAQVGEIAGQDSNPSDRVESLASLNNLLDTLASDTLAAGSKVAPEDGVNLATALGDLLHSLEKVRQPPDVAAVEAARRQALGVRTRSGSGSLSAISSSPSSSKEELRDPFAPSPEPDVFATLHRLIASLSMRFPTSVTPRRSQTPLPPTGIDGPRRFSSLDVPMTSSGGASLHSMSSRSVSSSPLLSPLTMGTMVEADTEAWTHVSHMLGLTRDLLASRRATYQGSPSPYEGSAAFWNPRSRHGSTSSSNPETGDLLAEAQARRNSSKGPYGASIARSATQSSGSGSMMTMVDQYGQPLPKRSSISSFTNSSTGGHSLPPRYSDDFARRSSAASDAQIRDWQARGLVPAYGLEEKTSSSRDRRLSYHQPSAVPERGILIKTSVPNSYEKQDSASSPRLGAAPASSKSRNADIELQELIDRLAQSGKRMEDQRAMPPPAAIKQKQPTSDSQSPVAEESDRRPSIRQGMFKKFSNVQLAALRRPSASKGKERATAPSQHLQASEDLPTADQFDRKAALRRPSATLRAMLFSDSKNHVVSPKANALGLQGDDALTSLPSASPSAQQDDDLLDLLASSCSRTRLAGQDAVMRASLSSGSPTTSTQTPRAAPTTFDSTQDLSLSGTLPSPTAASTGEQGMTPRASIHDNRGSFSGANLLEEQQDDEDFRQGAGSPFEASSSSSSHAEPLLVM